MRKIDRQVAAYRDLRPRLESASTEFVTRVRDIIDEAGINYLTVVGRAKGVQSYAAKAARLRRTNPDADPAVEITDQVGVRVITYVQADVDAVADLLAEQFSVLADRDLGRETASEGRFGYASRHLLVSLDRGEHAAYQPLNCASVQVRTVLQHAWAEFEHDIRYKGTVPPEQVPDLDRRFTLAAGLLELADREFTTIRDRLRHGASEPVNEPVAADAGEDPGTDVVDGPEDAASGPEGLTARELAPFLAGRYASAEWSRTSHYEWIAGLVGELGLDSIEALGVALAAVDSGAVTAAMGYRHPPGAVRRLDDDLLMRFREAYVGLPGNADRGEALRNRLARLPE